MTAAPPGRVLITADAVGGVWQYATTLASGLPQFGFEVVLAVLGPEPDPPALAAARRLEGVRVVCTGLPLDWLGGAQDTRAAAAALAALARREGVDLIHLNSPALAGLEAFATPVIAVAHGCPATWWDGAAGAPMPGEYAWHARAMGRGLRAADLAVAPSASFAEALRRRYRLPAAPAVVHNGRGGAPGPAARPRPPEHTVLTAGRLWDEAKNPAVLDRIAALVSAPFAAAGATRGPQGDAADLRHLEVLGHLGEQALAERLARRPLFVSPARFEPFGLSVLEAAGAGCALVLSDIPTFRELWNGAAAFAPRDDARAFAATIDHLLASPGEREALGEAARRRAGDYTAARMIAAMAGHYRTLLTRRVAA